MDMKYKDLNQHQQKIARRVKSAPNMQPSNFSGDGQIGVLAPARAMVRKGLLIEWRTSTFAPKDRNDPFWDTVPVKMYGS